MLQRKKIGYNFEKMAESFLTEKGYKILSKNFTIRGGEIDIICFKEGIISFVEVKGATGDVDFQNYITKGKISALKRTAEHWIYKNDSDDIQEYRFDLILIENGKIVDFLEGFIE